MSNDQSGGDPFGYQPPQANSEQPGYPHQPPPPPASPDPEHPYQPPGTGTRQFPWPQQGPAGPHEPQAYGPQEHGRTPQPHAQYAQPAYDYPGRQANYGYQQHGSAQQPGYHQPGYEYGPSGYGYGQYGMPQQQGYGQPAAFGGQQLESGLPPGALIGIVAGVVVLLLAGLMVAGVLLKGDGSEDGSSAPLATPVAKPSPTVSQQATQPVPPVDEEKTPLSQETMAGDDAVSVFDLQVGQCLEDRPGEGSTSEVTVVSCDQPHGLEMFAAFPVDGVAYPGEDEISEKARDGCRAEFESFVGTEYWKSELEMHFLYPSSDGWSAGDREVLCGIYNGSESTTGSLRGFDG